MKILLDVHISFKIRDFFIRECSCDSVHVNDILNGYYSADKEISHYADQHGYIVLTKDVDFKNTHLLKKVPRKLIRVCLGNISNGDLIALLRRFLPTLKKLDLEFTTFYCEISADGLTVIA